MCHSLQPSTASKHLPQNESTIWDVNKNCLQLVNMEERIQGGPTSSWTEAGAIASTCSAWCTAAQHPLSLLPTSLSLETF